MPHLGQIRPVAERFWEKVNKAHGDGCWEWTAARLQQDGKEWYGVFRVGSKVMGTAQTQYAHRMAWLLTHWLIPRGKSVLHRCDNPACVRPDHLFIGTHLDNMADMNAKGRGNNAYTINPPTHCKRGHEFSETNTATDSHGNRRCRMCAAMWTRIYSARRKSACV